jgi:hypothetical protein
VASSEHDFQAWRERGDDRLDPVRFRFIEAMAARAQAYGGDARRVLDKRVDELLAAYRQQLDAAHHPDVPAQPGPVPWRGPLAKLLEQTVPPDGPGRAVAELGYFSNAWSKLRAHRRLTQSLAKVPVNAGPLNSHHLVHRALSQMRELSPEYLQQFVAHVDALLWLEQISGGSGASATSDSPRAERRAKSGRGKSG